jgi:hypothetical protein
MLGQVNRSPSPIILRLETMDIGPSGYIWKRMCLPVWKGDIESVVPGRVYLFHDSPFFVLYVPERALWQ